MATNTPARRRQSLERAGHSVLEAGDGHEGLRLYRASPSEIVVTEIFMPERKGLETIAALRPEFPEVKIIAISGSGQPRQGLLYAGGAVIIEGYFLLTGLSR